MIADMLSSPVAAAPAPAPTLQRRPTSGTPQSLYSSGRGFALLDALIPATGGRSAHRPAWRPSAASMRYFEYFPVYSVDAPRPSAHPPPCIPAAAVSHRLVLTVLARSGCSTVDPDTQAVQPAWHNLGYPMQASQFVQPLPGLAPPALGGRAREVQIGHNRAHRLAS